MTWVDQIQQGTRVLVPAAFKPRGMDRRYDAGTVLAIAGGFATVHLDDDRVVFTAIGLLSPAQHGWESSTY